MLEARLRRGSGLRLGSMEVSSGPSDRDGSGRLDEC